MEGSVVSLDNLDLPSARNNSESKLGISRDQALHELSDILGEENHRQLMEFVDKPQTRKKASIVLIVRSHLIA
jgi:hypothetical protein